MEKELKRKMFMVVFTQKEYEWQGLEEDRGGDDKWIIPMECGEPRNVMAEVPLFFTKKEAIKFRNKVKGFKVVPVQVSLTFKV